MKPPCFDTEESYAQWLDHARTSKMTLVKNAHCADCTPIFKSKMRAVGRCDNPEYQFNAPEAQIEHPQNP